VKSNYNTVLQSTSQVEEAAENLISIGLFPHPDRVKSWDTWKIINIINRADRDATILDVGCNGSPILPMLRRLGFKKLYGCDISLKPRYPAALLKVYCTFFVKEYKPILSMLTTDSNSYHLSKQNLESTTYNDSSFDYVSSLSVVEHGVNIERYIAEMHRILKPGGFLLTSTDYWPEKVNAKSNFYSPSSPDNVFSREEIVNIISIAERNGFSLIEPIDLDHKDKVVHWKATGLKFTFIFFAMKKR
jgi:SAM-dependent methyltransferase